MPVPVQIQHKLGSGVTGPGVYEQTIPPNYNACFPPPPPPPPVWYFHMHSMMQRMYNSLSKDINEKINLTFKSPQV